MDGNYNGYQQNFEPQGYPVCPFCGAPIRSDASFCGNCGRSLNGGYVPVQQVPEKVGVFDYILMMIIFSLPIAGIIMMLYWGFSSTVGINRKNFARSYLVLYLIQLILVFMVMMLFGTIFGSIAGMGMEYVF